MPAPAVSRSVLITGCSTGIGQSTALWLAERGWMVFATDRQRESLEDLEAAARILLGLEWLLPDRAFDSLLRLQPRSLGA